MTHIVRLYAWGGKSRFHDYEMSDGSIRTLHDTESAALRRCPIENPRACLGARCQQTGICDHNRRLAAGLITAGK